MRRIDLCTRSNENRNSLKVAFSALATEQAHWDKEQQQIQNARKELEQDKIAFERAGGSELLQLIQQSQTSSSVGERLPDKLEDKNNQAPNNVIEGLRNHFQRQNHSVDDSLLLQALLCLCVGAATGQFIVLTGPPGSGKTSLVGKMAQAVGAGAGIVPVRPAWIDATDLIGFYNPGINRYQPTPFLEYVLQAKIYSDHNRLYCLVLDEMNLGRVENYAADFLSLLEKSREGEQDAELQLYSREIKNRFRAEIRSCTIADGDRPYAKQHEAALLHHMETYPDRLPFPNGLILFGTINVDETTHLPSPKFLDRSLTIQVSGTELPDHLGKPVRLNGEATEIELSWALSLAMAKQCLEAGAELSPKAQETWKLLMKWNELYFKPLGIRLSHRLPLVYRCYMGAASVLNIPEAEHQQVADTFVLSKIMPLISFRDGDKSETSGELKRNILEQWRDNDETKQRFPIVHSALETVLTRSGLIVRYLE